jgi:methyltransferase
VTVLYWTICLVALQRLAELAWARRNTARLRRLGAIEADAVGYPLFVLLHAAWLAGLALSAPAATRPCWPILGLFALLQLGRLWVILSLGRWWTTRILTLPGAPLVQTGPFRWLQHPNYLLVVA